MHELSVPCMVRSVISEKALPGGRARGTRDEGRSWEMMERQEMYLRFGEGELEEERREGSQSWEGKWAPTPTTVPCAQLAVLFLLGGLGSFLGTSASRQRGLSIVPQNSNPTQSQVLVRPVLGWHELGPVASPADLAVTAPSREVSTVTQRASQTCGRMPFADVKVEEQKLAFCHSQQ